MKISIIGWYGSETLGDRSILLGLLKIFKESFYNFELFLGSLNPFYTKRTIFEDRNYINDLSPDTKINIFDTTQKKELKKFIKKSDLLVLGGGPIRDLPGLRMIKFAFEYAKSQNTKTAILGCGVGPFYSQNFKKIAISIVRFSDLIVLRDKNSIKIIKELSSKFKYNIDKPIYHLFDPAIIPVGFFLKNHKPENILNEDEIVINLRDFPSMIFRKKKHADFDNIIQKFIKNISYQYKKVTLIPNHNFFHGGDDRFYLAKIKYSINRDNVTVLHKPLNLYETFLFLKTQTHSVGMRYHAIMFQTFLIGNNAIIDYTLPTNGKIISFLKDFNIFDFYKNFYINLHDEKSDLITFSENILKLKKREKLIIDPKIFQDTINRYTEKLKILFQ